MLPSALRSRVTTPEAQVQFKRWFDAAPIYSGPPLANQMGWQVARTVAKRGAIATRRHLRPSAVDPDLAGALDRDGIAVIPDFLQASDHARVRRAYEDHLDASLVRDVGEENRSGIHYLTGPVAAARSGDSGDVLTSVLGNDPRIVALAEHVIGRRVRLPLRLVLQQLTLGDSTADTRDREQVLHADKAYPCAKAIYAVDAIGPDASPFIYCPGTHRLTVERLRYEHAMGVQEARRRVGQATPGERGIDMERSRTVMGDDLRQRLGVVETPITCAANTLIIVNNAGFHRRGELQGSARRRTLWVNFYPSQRPSYGRLAFRAAKSVVDTDMVTRAPLAPSA